MVALIAFAGSAQAACSTAGAKKAFGQWGDQRNYVLAPDGGFESGAQGWDLDHGATPVAGNESFYLNSADDDTSLSLPAGSSAGSPPVCMDIGTPSFRTRTLGTVTRAASGRRPPRSRPCSPSRRSSGR